MSNVQKLRLKKRAAIQPLPTEDASQVGDEKVPQQSQSSNKSTGAVTLDTSQFGKKATANEIITELERRDELVNQVTSKSRVAPGKPSSSTGVVDPVRMATSEVSRPRESFLAPGASTTGGSASGQSSSNFGFQSFEDPDQHFLVLNIAYCGQRPIRDRPAFRCLGTFPEEKELPDGKKEVDKYVATAGPLMKGCNIWKMQMRRWFLVCKTQERQLDKEYCDNKIDTLKKLYLADRARRDAEFQKNREARQQGKTEQSIAKQVENQTKKVKKASKVSSRILALRNKRKRGSGLTADEALQEQTVAGTNDMPASLMRRKQDYAVISTMRDITKPVQQGSDDPEPAIIIWRFFATYEMGKEWASGIGARFVREYDTEVVDAYEWLYPEDVDREKIQEAWRNSEQNKIMLQHKSEPGRVAEFEQWCKSKGQEMPVTEVVADNIPGGASTLLPPSELQGDAPTGEIKLPNQIFTVAKLEGKNASDHIAVEKTGGAEDFDYLRRNLADCPGGKMQPTAASASTAGEDDEKKW